MPKPEFLPLNESVFLPQDVIIGSLGLVTIGSCFMGQAAVVPGTLPELEIRDDEVHVTSLPWEVPISRKIGPNLWHISWGLFCYEAESQSLDNLASKPNADPNVN